MTRTRSLSDALDADAELVERLSALLSSGISAAAAWRHLAESGSPVAALVAGEPSGIADRLARASVGAGTGAQCLAAAWRVGVDAGAALAPVLSALAEVLRDLAEGARERETALAGPRATSRIVLALPAIGLALGIVLGLDTLAVLIGGPLGWGCLVLGGGLIVVAGRWTRSLLERAARGDAAPGLALELIVIGLAAGMPPERARGLAAQALIEVGLRDETERAVEHVAFAASAGVPAGPLLQATARAQRRRARADAARQAHELGTKLVLPLGICVLPAFIALGVVPAGLAIIGETFVV